MSLRLFIASLFLAVARRLRRLALHLLYRGLIGGPLLLRFGAVANLIGRAGLRLAGWRLRATFETSTAANHGAERRRHYRGGLVARRVMAELETRLTLWRGALTLVSFAAVCAILPSGRFWGFAGSMPFLLAAQTLVVAAILRERFAAPSLNRWDEAASLIALGFGLMIAHHWLAAATIR